MSKLKDKLKDSLEGLKNKVKDINVDKVGEGVDKFNDYYDSHHWCLPAAIGTVLLLPPGLNIAVGAAFIAARMLPKSKEDKKETKEESTTEEIKKEGE
jgi:hypothetical protein